MAIIKTLSKLHKMMTLKSLDIRQWRTMFSEIGKYELSLTLTPTYILWGKFQGGLQDEKPKQSSQSLLVEEMELGVWEAKDDGAHRTE